MSHYDRHFHRIQPNYLRNIPWCDSTNVPGDVAVFVSIASIVIFLLTSSAIAL